MTIHRIEAEGDEPAQARKESRETLAKVLREAGVTFRKIPGGFTMTVKK